MENNGLKLGLNWVRFGFVLALFFLGIGVFGPKRAKIGFVLHKKLFFLSTNFL